MYLASLRNYSELIVFQEACCLHLSGTVAHITPVSLFPGCLWPCPWSLRARNTRCPWNCPRRFLRRGCSSFFSPVWVPRCYLAFIHGVPCVTADWKPDGNSAGTTSTPPVCACRLDPKYTPACLSLLLKNVLLGRRYPRPWFAQELRAGSSVMCSEASRSPEWPLLQSPHPDPPAKCAPGFFALRPPELLETSHLPILPELLSQALPNLSFPTWVWFGNPEAEPLPLPVSFPGATEAFANTGWIKRLSSLGQPGSHPYL